MIKKEISEIYRYRELLKQLIIKDIKLKYRHSYLGYIWSILNPLMMMLVLVVVFSSLFRFDVPNYPVYLLTGQVLFNFVAEATNMSVSSITGNGALLKKTYVPKAIFPISRVTSSLVNLLFSLVALALVMLITSTPISWYILLIPIVFMEVYLFTLGLSLLLASSTVFFRDIQYLWGVLISIWLYVTPIFYPVSIISDEYQVIYQNLNPMYGYLLQFRDLVLYAKPLPMDWLYQGSITAIVMLAIGLWVFNRKQNQFILYI
ncbi:ABC transporter permease [Avibacterium volantium]|uniref:Transport permease protein n=1 Tax=Avibacterium volantium TaxID=762 RepID=A0A3S4KW68_AVIVO|nr:ABC transporter permease [Avibacterium volantium]VEB22462.1 ABC-2 type transporter [Avibacterium volantium]